MEILISLVCLLGIAVCFANIKLKEENKEKSALIFNLEQHIFNIERDLKKYKRNNYRDKKGRFCKAKK